MPDGLRPPYDVNDGRTCSCMLGALQLVQYAFQRAGWIQQDFAGLVFQWSGRSDVSASAGTHKSGAVFDIAYRLVDSDAKLRTWQECGFTPFARFPPKFPYHGHNLVNGCPHLHPSAAAQIVAYRRGRDGLASNGPYAGPTDVTFRTWQRARVIYADLIEEMQMSAADVWGYDLDDDKPASFYVRSTRDSTLIIGRRTQSIAEDINELIGAVAALATTQKALAAQVKQIVDAQAVQRAELAELVQPALDYAAASAPLPTPEEEQS